jgi:hypothetical protein
MLLLDQKLARSSATPFSSPPASKVTVKQMSSVPSAVDGEDGLPAIFPDLHSRGRRDPAGKALELPMDVTKTHRGLRGRFHYPWKNQKDENEKGAMSWSKSRYLSTIGFGVARIRNILVEYEDGVLIYYPTGYCLHIPIYTRPLTFPLTLTRRRYASRVRRKPGGLSCGAEVTRAVAVAAARWKPHLILSKPFIA